VANRMKDCNRNIEEALKIAQELVELGQRGDEDREDDGCGVLYGVIRDAGYKIKTLAEKEKDSHRAGGRWN